MRELSWAAGEPAAFRRESHCLGIPMASRDKLILCKGNHPGKNNQNAFAGLNTQSWQSRTLDFASSKQTGYDMEKSRFRNLGYKRHGE